MVDLRLDVIRKKVHHIVESLQRISTLCNPKIGEPSVNPGGHEADVEVLVAGREDLRDKIYELTTNNSGRIHAEQVRILSDIQYITQETYFSTICFHLSQCVDRGDCEDLKKYGEFAELLVQQILEQLRNFDSVEVKQATKAESLETARQTFRKIKSLTSPVFSIEKVLRKIETLCLPPDGDAPSIGVRELDVEFNSIKSFTEEFETSASDFDTYLSSTSHLALEIFEYSSTLLQELGDMVNNRELTSVCTHLPIAIDQKNKDKITFYGQQVAELCNKMTDNRKKIERSLRQLQKDHVSQASYVGL
ncbi:Protein containing ALS2cr12 (ALS2CR12) signature [Caenorhabditis elegans]|uniref:Protein containing ALS2cr12 (ALS2CR12) signature n=1 Tax=Caenorhabditis elegans TaxID=6239 RepID=Q3V5H4_CAEEL|nr:Protein containing ALS2cr12 (ALS2CR12) signature [Caenorhabditis elegans]CCD66085.1 Protein containing ALS2cr12 (ALS2CR12) signature [Caenorhabditis elegans]|eukprot:NP_497153.2 Protein containing ALS2cr12 (ALS2CR12) signature [Caenorhabditis elegans]